MKDKIATLKEIRNQSQDLNPRNNQFDEQFMYLAKKAISCLEDQHDIQERDWILKGQDIINMPKEDSSNDPQKRDKALSYLMEAVNAVILRKENYRG